MAYFSIFIRRGRVFIRKVTQMHKRDVHDKFNAMRVVRTAWTVQLNSVYHAGLQRCTILAKTLGQKNFTKSDCFEVSSHAHSVFTPAFSMWPQLAPGELRTPQKIGFRGQQFRQQQTSLYACCKRKRQYLAYSGVDIYRLNTYRRESKTKRLRLFRRNSAYSGH